MNLWFIISICWVFILFGSKWVPKVAVLVTILLTEAQTQASRKTGLFTNQFKQPTPCYHRKYFPTSCSSLPPEITLAFWSPINCPYTHRIVQFGGTLPLSDIHLFYMCTYLSHIKSSWVKQGHECEELACAGNSTSTQHPKGGALKLNLLSVLKFSAVFRASWPFLFHFLRQGLTVYGSSSWLGPFYVG